VTVFGRRINPTRWAAAIFLIVMMWLGPGACLRGDSEEVDSAQNRLDIAIAEYEAQQQILAALNPDLVLQDAEIRLAELLPPTPEAVLTSDESVTEDISLFGSELTRCANTDDPLPVAVGEEGQVFGSEPPAPAPGGSPLMLESRFSVTYEIYDTDWTPLLECVLGHNDKAHIVVDAVSVNPQEDKTLVEASYRYFSCSQECEIYASDIEPVYELYGVAIAEAESEPESEDASQFQDQQETSS